jgi:hypothetical protein
MSLVSIAHLTITIDLGHENLNLARQLYIDVLGLKEIYRPSEVDSGTPGLWLQVGDSPQQVHIAAELGATKENNLSSKRHPCFAVKDLDELRSKLVSFGVIIVNGVDRNGGKNFAFKDYWGNRLEFEKW